VLYEVYDAPESHLAHRQSPHFLAYDAVARDAVSDKTVARCTMKYGI
jgi:quinol monooxygenase YgiN